MDEYCLYDMVILSQIYAELGLKNNCERAISIVTKLRHQDSLASFRLGYFKLKNSKFISWEKQNEKDILNELLVNEVIQG